jgi:MFS family permease
MLPTPGAGLNVRVDMTQRPPLFFREDLTKPGEIVQSMVWNDDRTSARFRLSAGGFLSWTFRGYEAYVLVVALGPILDALLSPFAASSLYFYAGIALGATLLGWGVGGLLRGLTVRAIGRRNTATYAVLGYAIFTGLTALSQSFLVFIGLRFLTGVMLGSEGERGSTLLAATHPDDRRARGGGSVHAGFGVGILLASVAWLALQVLNPQLLARYVGTGAWRYLFVIGVLPAIFVLYLRRTAEPSDREVEAATDEADRDEAPDESVGLTGLFGRKSFRGRVIVGVVLVFAAVAGWWGITAWIPVFASDIAEGAGVAQPARWGAIAGICYGIGAIAGCLTVEPITDRIGRIGSLMFMLIGSFATVQVLFLLIRTPYLLLAAVAVIGYFSVGQFGWFAVHLPEVFPREARETGLGAIYTAARLVGFAFPILVGIEITYFEGLTTVVPSLGAVYGVGIFVALFLPLGRETSAAEHRSS